MTAIDAEARSSRKRGTAKSSTAGQGAERTRRSKSEATIQFRVTEADRDMIDAAAAALGQTRTEFVLSSARRHAIDALLDQRFFRLGGDSARSFAEALDEAGEPNDALKALMREPAPWEP